MEIRKEYKMDLISKESFMEELRNMMHDISNKEIPVTHRAFRILEFLDASDYRNQTQDSQLILDKIMSIMNDDSYTTVGKINTVWRFLATYIVRDNDSRIDLEKYKEYFMRPIQSRIYNLFKSLSIPYLDNQVAMNEIRSFIDDNDGDDVVFTDKTDKDRDLIKNIKVILAVTNLGYFSQGQSIHNITDLLKKYLDRTVESSKSE